MVSKKEILTVLIILLILLVIGFFLYLRFGEGFRPETTPTPTPTPTRTSLPTPTPTRTSLPTPTSKPSSGCPTQAPIAITSITSLVSEHTIDVEPANDTTGAYYLISNTMPDEPAGILAVDKDNNLTLQILNDTRDLQNKWYLNKVFTDDPNKCVISLTKCSDIQECKDKTCLTFTTIYERNNVLTMQIFNNKDNQIWIQSTTKKANLSKALKIRQPTSLSSQIASSANNYSNQMTTDLQGLSLDEENSQKLKNVLDLISSNLQSYKNMTSGDSGAALSAGKTPIKINLSLGSAASALGLTAPQESSEKFGDTNSQNVRQLLADYENKMGPSRNTNTGNTTDSVYTLDTALGSVISCPKFDANDYAVSRVGQCNCDLSGLSQT